VVRAVSAAARRQSWVFAAAGQRRQRHEPEDQNQQDGKATPHLELILHDAAIFNVTVAPVNYHFPVEHSHFFLRCFECQLLHRRLNPLLPASAKPASSARCASQSLASAPSAAPLRAFSLNPSRTALS
jgi:hypothetical protein